MAANNTPFLLLRGLMREQRHWGDFVTLLQQQHPDADIITLDIPGNGHLYQRESPKSIAGMTDALRQQLKAATPINLIALSMGGMIAIDWATRYPEEISALVLINTSVSRYAPFYWRLRWQNYCHFLTMLWQNPTQKEQTIVALTSNYHQDDAKLVDNWQHWRQQCPVSAKNAYHQIRASATFKSLQKPSQPLLILTSSADRLVDYRCSVRLHEAWESAFEQHLTAGHDLPLDAPLWVSQVIKKWLGSGAK
ncbi:MAG: alpha/beta hydrolase [Methylococcales bacterium]|nr:alpha/beta hydrolase [Methylococcales bacterium]